MYNLSTWVQKRLGLCLFGICSVLLLTLALLAVNIFTSEKNRQNDFVSRLHAVALNNTSYYQLPDLNQMASIGVEDLSISLILFCDSLGRVAWSYPVSIEQCNIKSSFSYKVIVKPLFLNQQNPHLVFLISRFPQKIIFFTLIMGALLIVSSGIYLLWRIRLLVQKELCDPLKKIGQDGSQFSIVEIRDIHNSLIKLRKNEKLLATSAAIGNITTQIIHDLSGPLHSINVARDYLKKIKSDAPYFVDHVQLLELGSKRLTAISEGLLKKHKGEIQEINKFLLKNVIQDLIKEYDLQSKAVKFQVYLPEQQIELYGNATHLQRALGNIIKNAMEAMDGKGSVTISAEQKNDQVFISIADNGPGMSEETLPKVLQGGHSEGKTNGHGIGLKVVREVIEEFNGSFTAKSQIGQGTTFFIVLPLFHHLNDHETNLVNRQQRQCLNLAHRTATENGTIRNARVLVIDDDENIHAAWNIAKQEQGFAELRGFISMEACEAQKINYADYDIAFIDKKIPQTQWTLLQTITHLKAKGVKKVVIASGEPKLELALEPGFELADGLSNPEKIPKDLSFYL